MPYWHVPIVADAEAGFGGVLNAFELMKAMIEAGAAAVHFEDQLSSSKKCGHMGGKVLVPTQEAIAKLVAARLAADVLDVPTLIVARTDALAAKLLTSDIDPRDRAVPHRRADGGRLLTSCATGLEQAIARGLAYAPYADMVWCETSTPDLDEARCSPRGSTPAIPRKLLAYNCSPSFNWKQLLSDEQIAAFQRNLAAMGYKFQFVTLAGFHALNMTMFELAHAYRDEGMLAYSRLQQREFDLERDHGYRAVKHQAFVGAGYFDAVAQIVAAGQTSLAALDGSTEQEQFTEKTPVFTEAEIHHVAGDDVVRRRRSAEAGSTGRTGQSVTSLGTVNARRPCPCSTHFSKPQKRSSRPPQQSGRLHPQPRLRPPQGHGPGRARGQEDQVRQHLRRFRADVAGGQVHEEQHRQPFRRGRTRTAGTGPAGLGRGGDRLDRRGGRRRHARGSPPG